MELDKLIDQFKNQTMQETGTYTEPEDNAFDAPIPGQSLTDEPETIHGNMHPKQRQLKKQLIMFMKV